MQSSVWRATFAAHVLAIAGSALAQDEPLTLDGALALARQRAPRIAAARARVDEARGRLRGASVLLRENPVVEWAEGPRSSPAGDTRDRELSVSQALEWPGARTARVASARADVERETAESEDVLRHVLKDVAVAFLETLDADARLRQARAEEALAQEVAVIARRRLEAGDVAALDDNLSRAAVSRARSEVRDAEARQVLSLGLLHSLLGKPPGTWLTTAGDMPEQGAFAVDVPAVVEQRPDVRALSHALAQAESDVRLARALSWPQPGVSVRQQREQSDRILTAGITLTVPVFDRGQGPRAEAQARAARLRGELSALRLTAASEVMAAAAAYDHRRAALEELRRNALPLLEENEKLAKRSYEVGQIGLGELLLVRRETIETRKAYRDRALEAARARVEVQASSGELR